MEVPLRDEGRGSYRDERIFCDTAGREIRLGKPVALGAKRTYFKNAVFPAPTSPTRQSLMVREATIDGAAMPPTRERRLKGEKGRGKGGLSAAVGGPKTLASDGGSAGVVTARWRPPSEKVREKVRWKSAPTRLRFVGNWGGPVGSSSSGGWGSSLAWGRGWVVEMEDGRVRRMQGGVLPFLQCVRDGSKSS